MHRGSPSPCGCLATTVLLQWEQGNFSCGRSSYPPKYLQVRKTGVDEVHGKLPTDGLFMKRNVIC
jgi:hypothetical protein